MAMLKKRKSSAATVVDETVLYEDWCVKESGGAFLGKTNWRRRWFRLVQRNNMTVLQYFRRKHDRKPAGSVKLDVTYCTHPLESREKPYPNCFAVGPLIDNGSVRTYYISCSTQQMMQEWMAVIDAAIQGVPEQAQKRRDTVRQKFGRKKQKKSLMSSIGEEKEEVEEEEDLAASFSPSIDALNLSTSMETNEGQSVDSTGVKREDISDDELWESEEEEEEMEEETCTARGVTAKAKKRSKSTVITPDSHFSASSRLELYEEQGWRLERWMELCHVAKTTKWKKTDTSDGVTVARCRFGRRSHGHAVMKIEGILAADPRTVFQFLQLTTKEGGKLDYIFRNEDLLDEVGSEPKGTMIFNQFHPPLPRITKRDLVAMKLWVPQGITRDSKSGFVMFSIDHPEAPAPEKDSRRMLISPSGIILSPVPGPGNTVHTHTLILIQVALFGALHRMLKGAYNSGLLKLGLRTTFTHISDQLQRFVELINM